MQKKMLILIIGITLISLTSALYAGECMEIDLNELDNFDDLSYMVVGNSSDTEGMNITFNSETKNVSVCFAVNYNPDTFSLIFWKDKEPVIIPPCSSGGGGGGTKKVYIENKTYIEIPNYIDRPVIEYVDKEESSDETQEPTKPTSRLGDIIYIGLVILLLVLIFLIINLILQRIESYKLNKNSEIERIKYK